MARYEEKIVITGEDRASDKFEKAGGSWSKLTSTIGKAATIAGIGLAADSLINLGVSSTKMAISAAEAASAFDRTFGPAAAQAGLFVEEFANKAGLADYELQQLLATTGSVIQGLGATEAESAEMATSMARLAGDVASFRDVAGGAGPVLAAMQSALTGEREALKTYGIVISEADVQQRAFLATGKQTAEALTLQEKAQATLTLMWERAGKSVGDLEATQGSAANQIRDLTGFIKNQQVAFGNALIPAVEKAIPVLKDLVPIVADVGVAAAETVAALGPLIDLVGLLTGWYTDLRGKADELSRSDSKLEAATGDLLKVLTGSAIGAIPIIIDRWEELTGATGEATAAADGLRQASDKHPASFRAAGAAAKAAGAAISEAYQVKALPSVHNLTTELLLALETQENLSNAMLAAADPLFGAVDAWQSYQETLGAVNEDGKVTAEETVELWKEQLRLNAALGDVDSKAYEDAMLAIQLATGQSREEIEEIIRQIGLLDGLEANVTITIDEVAGGGSGSRRGRSFRDPYLSHTGGIVPDLNNGGPVPSLLLPGEAVYTSAEHQRLMARLASGEGGSRTVNLHIDPGAIVVHAGAGADGPSIGRDIEARLARSDLIRRLPERIL